MSFLKKSLLLLLLLGVWSRIWTYDELIAYQKSPHFEIYCTASDQVIANQLLEHAETSYHEIAVDFQGSLTDVVSIKVYPTLEQFHASIGHIEAADWLVGQYRQPSRTISMVSPLNPGPQHTYDSLFSTLTHHVANAVMLDTFEKPIPNWLRIGAAMHASDQFFLVQETLYELSKGLDLPLLPQLEAANMQRFQQMHGFAVSYLFVAYIEERWGWGAVVELLRHPAAFESILGMTQEQFHQENLAYLQQHNWHN